MLPTEPTERPVIQPGTETAEIIRSFRFAQGIMVVSSIFWAIQVLAAGGMHDNIPIASYLATVANLAFFFLPALYRHRWPTAILLAAGIFGSIIFFWAPSQVHKPFMISIALGAFAIAGQIKTERQAGRT